MDSSARVMFAQAQLPSAPSLLSHPPHLPLPSRVHLLPPLCFQLLDSLSLLPLCLCDSQ